MQSIFLHEIKRISQLAAPLMLAQLAQTAMGFTDTIMAGHYSVSDLAAVSIGTGLWIPILLLVNGILMALTPLIAHAWGEESKQDIGILFKHGVILSLVIGVLFGFIVDQSTAILPLLGTAPHLITIIDNYLFAIALSIPGFALFQVLRSFTEAMTHTKMVMLFSIVALIVNIPVNYVFIYGKLGIPEYGGYGCGIATAISIYFSLGAFILYLWLKGWFAGYQFSLINFRLKPFTQILLLGIPIGGAIFVETSVFCIIALAIISLGEVVISGHQIALSVSSLLFMLPLSLSHALTIRIGNLMGGSQQRHHIRETVKAALGLSLAIACMNASIIYFFRVEISHAYTQSESVIAIATHLLLFSAIFQFSDSIQVVCAGGLRGFKCTTAAFWITIVAFWCFAFPVGYLLTFTDYLTDAPLGAQGFWIGLISGLSFAALLLGWYLYYITQAHSLILKQANQ